MSSVKSVKILAFDTSLSRPGVAIIEILASGKPRIVAMSHVTTNSRDNHAVRTEQVYGWVIEFLRVNGTKYDAIVREDFKGRSSRQNHPVHSAWHAVDRALNTYGIPLPIPEISQSEVKKLVVGRGNAEKDEVADAVREITGYKGDFAVDDESDAAAIGLAFAIKRGLLNV